ncbi:LAMI_0G11276g1_1 [Lachancea mirantina]|uniref:Uracil-DNA glycosylase n=1 Tax=Lachancea mirantina TaxID=1230905 RepID=A0A1G4KAW8_9SACH|nr:LAMI_0G11276g1_1 [Lachancea mirantina]
MTEAKRPREDSRPADGVKRQKSIAEFFGSKQTNLKKAANSEKKYSDADAETGTAAGQQDAKLKNMDDITKSPKTKLVEKLTAEQKRLLALEIDTLDDAWFEKLKEEFQKPYFLKLKEFVTAEQVQCTVFPPPQDIYSWSRLTPFDKVRVVVIGQDPYHNYNQAHGLAFSVRNPTPAPPSLRNIYKELRENNYADFQADNKVGDLSHWAKQGVLLLNTSLTVRAHNANSHSKHGWEQFTKRVVQTLIHDRRQTKKPLVFLLWGSNAMNLVQNILGTPPSNILVLKSVHPSPLSASRGFFGNQHFRKINDWLYDHNDYMIDWSVVEGAQLSEVEKKNLVLDV